MPALSVVISVDAKPADFKRFLSQVVGAVAPLNGSEILVVDSTSNADVANICRSQGVCFYRTQGERIHARKVGASYARGDYFLFLETDTVLPEGFADIWRHIRRRGYIWGFFALRFNGASWLLRCLARVISVRSRLSGISVEEQGLFVQRNAWKLVADEDEIASRGEIAGNGEIADEVLGAKDVTARKIFAFQGAQIQAHIDLCRRLRAVAQPCVVRNAVESQNINWHRLGLLRAIGAGLSSRLHPRRQDSRDWLGDLKRGPVNRRKRAPELP